jgi:hypothetical protein
MGFSTLQCVLQDVNNSPPASHARTEEQKIFNTDFPSVWMKRDILLRKYIGSSIFRKKTLLPVPSGGVVTSYRIDDIITLVLSIR